MPLNIDDVTNAAIAGNIPALEKAFDEVIKDQIDSLIDTRKHEVALTLGTNTEEEADGEEANG